MSNKDKLSFLYDDRINAQYINTLLLKKYVGIPNAYPEASLNGEYRGLSRQKVFNYQILSQEIPLTAPTGQLTLDNDFLAKFTPGSTNITSPPTRKTVSGTYSYIVKYENIPLTWIKPGISYKGPSDISNANLLENIIPETFDATSIESSYKITLTDKNGKEITNNAETSWIVDPDLGILTYYGKIPLEKTSNPDDYNVNPLLSFWRYEGKIGAASAVEFSNDILTGPPNAPTDLKVDTRTSFYIDFSWTYPAVQTASFTDQYLPYIKAINIAITKNNGTVVFGPVDLSDNFIKTPTNQSPVIKIRITSQSGQNGFIGNTYMIYDISKPSLDVSNNKLNIFYKNTKDGSGASVFFDTYTDGNPPGTPANLSVVNPQIRSLDISGTTGWPDRVLTNTIPTETIQYFDVSYNITGNTRRFGGPVAHSGVTLDISNGSTYTVSGEPFRITKNDLYPDSTYALQIRAKNTGSQRTGDYSSVISETTLGLPPPRSMPPTFSYPTGSYYYVSTNTIADLNGTAIDTNIKVFNKSSLTSAIGLATDYSGASIHTFDSRGSSATNLMRLRVATPSKTVSQTYSGFGKNQPDNISIDNNGIGLTCSEIIDGYSATQDQGYYLYPRVDISFNSTAIDISSAKQTFSLIRDISSGLSWTIDGSTNLVYYVDEAITNPTLGITLSMVSNVPKHKISGVEVINTRSIGTDALNVNISATGLGTYFYRKPWLDLSGTNIFDFSANEIPPLSGGQIATTATKTFNPTLRGLTNTFFNTIQVDGYAYNCNFVSPTTRDIPGRSGRAPGEIKIVGDCFPSSGYSNNINDTTIGILTGTATPGIHIALQNTNDNPSMPSGYNHNISLINQLGSLNGLQFCGQRFRTKANAQSYSPNYGYYKYSDLSGNGTLTNTVDYSVIRGKGWAAFAWKLNTGENIRNTIELKFNDPEGVDIIPENNNRPDPASTNGPIELYYGYVSNSSIFSAGSVSYTTTKWVDGISRLLASEQNVTDNSILTTTNQKYLRGYSSRVDGSTIRITGTQINTQSTAYFVCVIGISNTTNFTFSNISARHIQV